MWLNLRRCYLEGLWSRGMTMKLLLFFSKIHTENKKRCNKTTANQNRFDVYYGPVPITTLAVLATSECMHSTVSAQDCPRSEISQNSVP